MKRGKVNAYTISAVATQFDIHPQTLRLYEREGLEIILSLTRDLGVNLAGVEIILNMREKMDAMQREFERFFQYLQQHAAEFTQFTETPRPEEGALVPVARIATVVRRRTTPARG
jgi:MerR family transcriptional regulator/heat shock protein HspR